MENLAIRRCTAADAEVFSVVANRSFYDAFIHTCSEEDMRYFLSLHYDADTLRQEIEAGKLRTWLAWRGRDAVGFFTMAQRQPSFPLPGKEQKAMELVRLYVLKAYHGKGIAHRLMQFFLSEAEKAHCPVQWLGVWEHNARAQAFYRKYGFTPTAYTHPFTIGLTLQTDQWWLRKSPKELL